MKNKKRSMLIVSAVLILVIGFAIKGIQSYNNTADYRQAIEYIMNDDYEQAKELLYPYKTTYYKDAYALYKYCNACQEYDKGHLTSAYDDVISLYFKYLNTSQRDHIRNKIDEIEKAYDDRPVTTTKEYTTSKPSIPYVGMSESMISSTGLGTPSSTVRHNTQMVKGEVHKTNLYDFYNGKQRIFTARCIDGKVTEVWDDRNATTTCYNYTTNRNKTTTDPYNANQYSNEDDFYYDHYDDFYDYYDAEDYYNEHHDD